MKEESTSCSYIMLNPTSCSILRYPSDTLGLTFGAVADRDFHLDLLDQAVEFELVIDPAELLVVPAQTVLQLGLGGHPVGAVQGAQEAVLVLVLLPGLLLLLAGLLALLGLGQGHDRGLPDPAREV